MIDHFQIELRAKNSLFEKENLQLVLRDGCQDLASKLVSKLSIRQIARRMKRSPEYLRLIQNGIGTVDEKTYLTLLNLWKSETKTS